MKVKELIKKLQELDLNAEVVVSSDNFELNGATVDVSDVILMTNCRKVTKTFTDGFDYEDYKTEVWEMINGEDTIVKIY